LNGLFPDEHGPKICNIEKSCVYTKKGSCASNHLREEFQMAELYRKAALERISSPEQLDKVLKITSPFSWLSLVGIALMTVAAVIWSVMGTIPETITANGIIVSPVSTNAVYASEMGEVTYIQVAAGDVLQAGDPVLTYCTERGEEKTVFSDQEGIVSAVMVDDGDVLLQGRELVRVSPATVGQQVAVCYVPLTMAGQLECGMRAYVYLNGVKNSQSGGHMDAKVINVDAYAASTESMSYVLGTNNELVNAFLQEGPVVAVTCELQVDEAIGSGYRWSSKKGAEISVNNGALATTTIVTEEIKPISKLFPNLG